MVVKNTILEFLNSRGITRYSFWKETGISRPTAYKVADDPYYIPSGATINAICKAYDLQPGEFIKYVEE